jgi:hypothetical protein
MCIPEARLLEDHGLIPARGSYFYFPQNIQMSYGAPQSPTLSVLDLTPQR